MKKILSTVLILALTAAFAVLPVSAAADTNTETISYNYTYTAANGYQESDVHTREMEKLDRGLVAVKVNGGVYLSWRLFDSEDAIYGSSEDNVAFDIYRDGEKIATERNTTNYLDTKGTTSSTYLVVPEGESIEPGISYEGSAVTVKTPISGLTAYAAKYNEGKLENVISKSVFEGETTFDAGFDVDKVFLWNGMQPVENGQVYGVTPYSNNYFDIPVKKPQPASLPKLVTDKNNSKVHHFADASGNYIDDWRNEKVAWINYEYTINDCSTGDVDGDGQYEIIVKWDCNGQDNSFSGVTGNVYLDAYEMDGTFLWRIDLGKNIRAGAHYTQFLVYDLDGDGKAEVACKTAPGSKDGKGNYVSKASTSSKINSLSDEDNETDYRNAGGYILDGPEYYTVFNGQTGEAIDTIEYPFLRGKVTSWGNNEGYGNRVDRYLGGIAYLDGVHPSLIAWRGYYGKTTVAAITLENGRLKVGSKFSAETGKKYSGQGNHNLTVADVDNDGKDEIICGSLALDDNLTPLWSSGRGHGDALHIGDYDPTHPGLEYFSVHEDGGYEISGSTNGNDGKMADYGMTVYDAATGEELAHYGAGNDTGRGVMANVGGAGYYQINGAGTYQSNGGTNFSSTRTSPGSNFRIFWDGDLYDELLDGTKITDGNGSRLLTANGCVQVNGTKANPGLQADLFGDWREEVIYPTSDNNSLRVYMTTTQTNYKIKTLMHDPVYRSGVAAEQTAYNQPPHVGFYMGAEMFEPSVESIEITSLPTKRVYSLGEDINLDGMVVNATLADGTTKEISTYAVSGYDSTTAGEQTVTITYMGKTDTFTVTVKEITKIEIISLPSILEVPQGGTLKTDGLVVIAYYADGESFEITDYTLKYSTSEIGVQTVTVEYMGKTETFEITVTEANVSALNGTYASNTTAEDNLTVIPIGEHSGNFFIMHNLTINSLPASGSGDRNSTAGFFLRFMTPPGSAKNDGVGGGWYFAPQYYWNNSESETELYWKSSGSRPDDAIRITYENATLKVGETYSFMYKFTNVGTGDGALMDMIITDSNGETVGSGTGLDLRNLTNSTPHMDMPLTYIQIYNQAREGTESSVTISDTRIIER